VHRLLRILRNTTILLSFLLMILSIVFWIRSYITVDWLTYSRTTRIDSYGNETMNSVMLRSSLGRIVFAFGPYAENVLNPLGMGIPNGFNWFRRPAFYPYDINNYVIWERMGFQIISSRKIWPAGPIARGFQIPFWFLTVLTALPAALYVIHRLRQKQQPPHRCPICGYDLRATPDRCPECGTVASHSNPEAQLQ
jgi:hypothetical protein